MRIHAVLPMLLAGCAGGGEPVEGAEICGVRCLLEEGERCDDCYAKLATCCYRDDPANTLRLTRVLPVCHADPGCVACCNECAALSCDELLANGNCPTGPRPL